MVLGGELLHCGGLAGSPQNRLQHVPGQNPVIVGLEFVGERVEDAEEAGNRIDLDGQCRRAEHHRVTASQVGADQLPHFGVNP